ncbi:ATP-binding protein [Spirosoma oryzicola]|uniref:ATP-binding protein n=1 Tax=Spirosoma oryzicola TaxID=2898794 RepID=UPI001E4CE0AA|nr:ATP-binding protein [Spirosoma oryzicola]UHG94590.1 ATP-binding protein [Spirosoma oryzicola]
MKYNLAALEWQQFEVLAFQCLQFDVSKSVQYVQGGSDKGRDIVYEGITNFFDADSKSYKYIFQVKHKSNIANFAALKSDLAKELDKVYIKNKLFFDRYCLVTNLAITASQLDELQVIFSDFITTHSLPNTLRFNLYNYQHIEACIDNHDSLKWNFPKIVKQTDFKLLLDGLFKKHEKNITTGWIEVFKKNQEKFVYTKKFSDTLDLIQQKNIVLLSGPPKSGKSFTAEMLALYMFLEEEFIVYKLDRFEDFDKYFDSSQKQLFLFDDAFGKHNLEYTRSDAFDRKIEFILNLLGNNHKCVFTSRAYIYKALKAHADFNFESILSEITVEVSSLSTGEKDSIFRRYFTLKFPTLSTPEDDFIENLVNHTNYAPETVRAYFENADDFDKAALIQHLNAPDAYLKTVFINLLQPKKLVLLALLFSTTGTDASIAYAYRNVRSDVGEKELINLKEELEIMVGSVIKKSGQLYNFYHPSMFDFFVNYLGNDLSQYRQILFRNINIELLSLAKFKTLKTDTNSVEIKTDDIEDFILGTKRLLKNNTVSLYEINSLIHWIDSPDSMVNFQVKLRPNFNKYMDEMLQVIKELNFTRFINDNTIDICIFFDAIRKLVTISSEQTYIDPSYIEAFLQRHQSSPDYWHLVFSLTPYLRKEEAIALVTASWLNNFYKKLEAEIDSLGHELFGEAYPNFTLLAEKKQLIADKKFAEANKILQQTHADFKLPTSKLWYPRYKSCKEKMMVMRNSRPLGDIIYQRLTERFSFLTKLEENQKNRYFHNTQKKWW